MQAWLSVRSAKSENTFDSSPYAVGGEYSRVQSNSDCATCGRQSNAPLRLLISVTSCSEIQRFNNNLIIIVRASQVQGAACSRHEPLRFILDCGHEARDGIAAESDTDIRFE